MGINSQKMCPKYWKRKNSASAPITFIYKKGLKYNLRPTFYIKILLNRNFHRSNELLSFDKNDFVTDVNE